MEKTYTNNRIVPIDYKPKTQKIQGSFLALTSWAKVYKKDLNHFVPLVAMQMRWDGTLGFIGGKVEKNESIIDTLVRESKEEANFSIYPEASSENIKHVITVETQTAVVHLHQYDLGILTQKQLSNILANASQADYSILEGSLVWVHLAVYEEGKTGWDNLINSKLQSAVYEELIKLREIMLKEQPVNAFTGRTQPFPVL